MNDSSNNHDDWPTPPSYNPSNPIKIDTISGEQITQLAGPSSDPSRYFWRNIAWSPTGSHFLAQSDDHHLDLFRLNEYVEGKQSNISHIFSLHSPTTLLSFAWYPFARLEDPQTWCFMMSARDVTIRLIDAFQGKTRATYGIQDHTERFKGAQAMSFNLDGTKVYCAYDGFLSVIQLDHPGINRFSTMRLTASNRATKSGKANLGQRGMISCIAVANDCISNTENEIVAIGTYAGNVGIYQITNPLAKMGEEVCLIGWKEEHSNGITQISFHPTAPHILFLNSRRNPDIRAYDLRYVGSRRSFLHPAAEVGLLGVLRCQDTNEEGDEECNSQQRLFFHLDWAGRYLIGGGRKGKIRVWNVMSPDSNGVHGTKSKVASEDNEDRFFGRILRPGEDARIPPSSEWSASVDAVPAVAFHPLKCLLIAASGSRSWPLSNPDEAELSDDEDDGIHLDYVVKDGAIHLFKLF